MELVVKVKIDVDGKKCGYSCGMLFFGLIDVYYCRMSGVYLEENENKNPLRCQECLDAEVAE